MSRVSGGLLLAVDKRDSAQSTVERMPYQRIAQRLRETKRSSDPLHPRLKMQANAPRLINTFRVFPWVPLCSTQG